MVSSKPRNRRSRPAQGIAWRLISVPIYVKVFGIGLLISLLFATIAFRLMRDSVLQAHYQVHGDMALSVAFSLAARLESADLADKAALDRDLDETIASFPGVRYILVYNAKGDLLSHGFTFPKEASPAKIRPGNDPCAACHAEVAPLELSNTMLEFRPETPLPKGSLRAYRRAGGLVLDVTVPIGDGHAGSVRLGVGDKKIYDDLATVNRSIVAGMVLCLFATVCSAFLLTYVLNKPIRALLKATRVVAAGDFSARAPIYSGDELGRLAVAFNAMTESLADLHRRVLRANRLAAIGEFAAGAAHEINNPLDGVMGCLARLERDPGNMAQNMEYLGMMRHALERVTGVIQRLLEYSRTQEVRVRPEDARSIVENVAALVGMMARRNAVDLAFDFSDAPPVRCDRFHVEQALLNLALNGLAAMEQGNPGGTLTFRVTAEAPWVRLEVEDTGCGIAPENLDRIFDTFFTTKEPGKGTGLGLAIVKEIVETHSGKIIVESVVGKGSVFRMYLPAASAEGEEPGGKRA